MSQSANISAKPAGNTRLIFNADDLGICSCINNGIERAHVHGVLTSASLAVNGCFAEDALAICRRHPSLDVGLHLALTELKPLSDPASVATLLRKSGYFHENVQQLLLSAVKGRIDLRQVKLEAEAQIKWAVARGIQISHLDSHQNWHIWPPFFNIVCELAEKYGISDVRVPKESFSLSNIRAHLRFRRLLELSAIHGVCATLSTRVRSQIRANNFTGFYYGGQLTKPRLMSIISTITIGSCTEIMCHPAQPTELCPLGHYEGYDGLGELQALTDPEVKALIQVKNIELSTRHAHGGKDAFRRTA